MRNKADPAEQVYLVPAFVGLGAPYWDAEARGAIFGLTRNSGPAEIAQAALEAVGYQTRGLLDAMRADWPVAAATVLRVDGGMTASDVAMQFLADILGAPGRSPSGDGNDRAGRRLSRRIPSRRMSESGRILGKPGGSIAASSRRWTKRPAPANGPAGRRPSPAFAPRRGQHGEQDVDAVAKLWPADFMPIQSERGSIDAVMMDAWRPRKRLHPWIRF